MRRLAIFGVENDVGSPCVANDRDSKLSDGYGRMTAAVMDCGKGMKHGGACASHVDNSRNDRARGGIQET